MKTNKIKVSDIKIGPIRQEVLPNGFVVRVQKYKEIIKEVEISSIEETLSNFQRDLYPEKELLIWENMAHFYEISVRDNPDWTSKDKKKIFDEILMSTLS
ncbi:hypothetical protein AUJ77_03450 [Candidatus Nomurabacteria bacterium CG1_02_43_90]|uniref:Uncharacterized protein n=1 Tax=Candidatus Nomurabacteria bacterium CG1_02_43_90 TaxID=1805281 RepID=A0A1J4V7L4_9BACT|nr:MAG: hypothetical protein AUJ77_03450 [Candidatus Nomurabacteria bacterium CG1_02_43_90]